MRACVIAAEGWKETRTRLKFTRKNESKAFTKKYATIGIISVSSENPTTLT